MSNDSLISFFLINVGTLLIIESHLSFYLQYFAFYRRTFSCFFLSVCVSLSVSAFPPFSFISIDAWISTLFSI